MEYKLTIKEKLDLENLDNVTINVQRNGLHNHLEPEIKRPRICGKKRNEVFKTVMTEHNGSSNGYVTTLAANGVPQMNRPLLATIRKIVSQCVNEEMVTTSWITNVLYSSDMAAALLNYKNGIHGYVQKCTVRYMII